LLKATVIIVKVLLNHCNILKVIEKMHDLCKTNSLGKGYKYKNLLSGIIFDKMATNIIKVII